MSRSRDKFKNMEMANKRLLKEQFYNPLSWITSFRNWYMEQYTEGIKDYVEDQLEVEFTGEQQAEILRLFQEEGMVAVEKYISELVKTDTDPNANEDYLENRD